METEYVGQLAVFGLDLFYMHFFSILLRDYVSEEKLFLFCFSCCSKPQTMFRRKVAKDMMNALGPKHQIYRFSHIYFTRLKNKLTDGDIFVQKIPHDETLRFDPHS